LLSIAIVDVAIIGFLSHLVILHIFLSIKGLTTFEYIKQKEDRKKESKIVKRIRRSPSSSI
jgi:hypothetical protein